MITELSGKGKKFDCPKEKIKKSEKNYKNFINMKLKKMKKDPIR